MKIMTLNTWQERGPWQERWEITREGIHRYQPDIILFQEVFNAEWAAELQKRTSFSTLIFPKEPCGLVMYSRYPVSHWGVLTLTPSPLEEYGRYGLWAQLKVGTGKLVILNTHLSWQLEDGASREKQAQEILHLVEEKGGSEELILGGDLNAPPDSPEIRNLVRKGRFRDLFVEKHRGEAGFSWDNRNPYAAECEHPLPDRRIDYLLLPRNDEARPLLKNLVSCDLIFTEPNGNGVWASDHFGLLAEFQNET